MSTDGDAAYPPVALMDGLGAVVRLYDSRTQEGCAVLRIEPAKFSSEYEVILNRSTASLLRKALGLWLDVSEDRVLIEDPDELE